MSKVSYNRMPCPGRIWDDMGGAFSMGCGGGAIIYFFKGFLNSPKKEKFFGGIRHLKNRAPVLGGSFAMWGALFSTTECLMIYMRRKDDPFNAIVAGFMTGGLLTIRGGMSLAFKNAVIGGLILGLIEGTQVLLNAYQVRNQMQMAQEMRKQQMMVQQAKTQKIQEAKQAESGAWGDYQDNYTNKELEEGNSNYGF